MFIFLALSRKDFSCIDGRNGMQNVGKAYTEVRLNEGD